jgi:ATP synthase F1 gamma subunit
MSRQEEIKKDLLETEAVQFVAGALTEIAAKKIKEVRDTFKNSRAFYDELRTLYALVKSASLQIEKNSAVLNVKKAEKTLLVAITSNHRFYGALNRDVMDASSEGAKYTKGDLLVVGKTGAVLLNGLNLKSTITRSLIFERDIPSKSEMRKFTDELSHYDRILFYYPQFITILTQHIASVDFLELVIEAPMHDGMLTHIFEPELPLILKFFETEIRRLLIVRVIREAELARTALRLVSMSRAEQEAGERVHMQRIKFNKMNAELQNMRLLETFSGIIKWKKKLYG